MKFHELSWLFAAGFWFTYGVVTALIAAYCLIGIIKLIVNKIWKPK